MQSMIGWFLLPVTGLGWLLWPRASLPAAERLHQYWEANGMTIDPRWLAGETEEMRAMVAQVAALRQAWREHLNVATWPTNRFGGGRGLVVIGGWANGWASDPNGWASDHAERTDYTLEALMAIASVRLVGCNLPVELWHPGDERLRQVPAGALATSGAGGNSTSNVGDVVIRNMHDYFGGTSMSSYMVTSFAIKHSRFDEILFLDADNVALRNPEAAFENAAYKLTGALFWPDSTLLSSRNPMWGIIARRQPKRLMRAEPGQCVIDRGRHWKAIELLHYFNSNGKDLYWKWTRFDSELPQYAWIAIGQEFAMVDEPVGMIGSQEGHIFCGHSLAQFHPDLPGRVMFMHRVASKWSRTRKIYVPTSTLKRGFHPTGLEVPWPYPGLDDPSWVTGTGRANLEERLFYCGFCKAHGPHCMDLWTGIDDSADGRAEVERARRVESELLELRGLISNDTDLLPSWWQMWQMFVSERQGSIFAV